MGHRNVFGLRRPCPGCPFRADRTPFLRAERAEEFADALEQGDIFWCHKTVSNGETDCGEPDVDVADAMFCAGALATLEREERPNNAMRIGERLGLYRPELMDRGAPVHESLSAWVAAHHSKAGGSSESADVSGGQRGA
jgi:hypothetical protein